MTTDRLGQWTDLVASCYAPDTAASWDAVGLHVGARDDPVGTAMVSLDVTPAVIDEAVDRGADLVIAHHPLLFRPLDRLTPDTAPGAIALHAARQRVAVLAVHTNFDAAVPGTTEPIVAALGLVDVRPLEPLEDDPQLGLGRVGTLAEATPVRELADRLAHALPAPHLRVAGPLDRTVRHVAACGGAGDGLLAAVHHVGAELYVTGDLRHHVVLDALTLGLSVIDAGHFATEAAALPTLHDRLSRAAAARGLGARLLASTTTTEPWSDYCAHHVPKATTS
jgi:dinuclear metal center YbgI/SA1388 family protein